MNEVRQTYEVRVDAVPERGRGFRSSGHKSHGVPRQEPVVSYVKDKQWRGHEEEWTDPQETGDQERNYEHRAENMEVKGEADDQAAQQQFQTVELLKRLAGLYPEEQECQERQGRDVLGEGRKA